MICPSFSIDLPVLGTALLCVFWLGLCFVTGLRAISDAIRES